MAIELPRNLIAPSQDDAILRWTSTLDEIVAAAAHRWSLRVDAPFQPGGVTAWVAPAHLGSGEPCVLKLAWRHPEATNEADALRVWAGDGAVRLLDDADDLGADTNALLLERCAPGTGLDRQPEPEQDVVITGLLRRLWVAPPDPTRFRTLQTMCDEWAEGVERRAEQHPADLDPGIVRVGLALLRELARPAADDVLIATDLHAQNVLAAAREPWLVIDPKPHVGDRTYDLVQHLLNCPARLHADPHALCRRLADLAGVDPERLQSWLFARCVQESPTWEGLAPVAARLAP